MGRKMIIKLKPIIPIKSPLAAAAGGQVERGLAGFMIIC